MNQYSNYEVDLKTHAYERYRERVGKKSFSDVLDWCKEQILGGNYGAIERGLINIDGVWFACRLEEQHLILVTCYGRTTANLPAGMKWALKHNDRINLDTISGIGVMPP
ncbi:hypothetical protein [Paenibacillus whitsoniae]|uniref:Uncharacterized protein n=1 Tax=Paenibacillus whitsoniae TaxID=2496558 RepID=A0A430J7X9_9BACL|nr:hypothetical protein [Paenibacillus whitsoniae]RTE05502.1 hypothetical protein EJQ19_25100 [Paenibacillus whitsoniae]